VDVIEVYEARIPTLKQVAKAIEESLEKLLSDVSRIDRITTRVKEAPSFAGKARKIDPASGTLKYRVSP